MHAQVTDLPPDVWSIVREDMNPTEWAIACGFSRESFAMRLKILVAELCSKHASHRHICMGQLQLDQWPACHSLNLNLWQLGENVRLDPAQIQRLDSASKALPLLQCLHLVGRGQVPLRDSTIEGLLVRLLARHVSVLTLQVKTVDMPLDLLPNLQHLVLDLDTIPARQDYTQTHGSLFSAISMLKGLRTLYVQSAPNACSWSATGDGSEDLTGCKHLHHVVLQDFKYGGMLALPAGCCLHAICEPYDLLEKLRSPICLCVPT